MQSANILRKGTANFIMAFCSWRKLTICWLCVFRRGYVRLNFAGCCSICILYEICQNSKGQSWALWGSALAGILQISQEIFTKTLNIECILWGFEQNIKQNQFKINLEDAFRHSFLLCVLKHPVSNRKSFVKKTYPQEVWRKKRSAQKICYLSHKIYYLANNTCYLVNKVRYLAHKICYFSHKICYLHKMC